MSETGPYPAAFAGNLIKHARAASATVMSGMAIITPLAATEALVFTPDLAAADASTPHEIATMSRTPQVQEYGKVIVRSSESGAVIPNNQTFTLVEVCKDGARKVHRAIKAKANSQEALGDCNEDKPVEVEPEEPAGGQIKPAVKRILKATRHNNHFVFTEVAEETPTSPAPAGGSQTGSGSGSTGGGSTGTGSGGGSGGGTGGTGGGGTGGSGGGGGTANPFAPGNIGADVGPYQCDGPGNSDTTIEGVIPAISYAMVDLEDGLGYSVNPCLSAEVSALTAAGVTVDYYINTGWYSGSSHLDTNTPKVCAPGDSVCDAYDYGAGNVSYVVGAVSSLGISITGKRVFRDGETDNTWATGSGGQADSEQAAENESSLQGAQDTLIADGAADSLLYENPDFENTVLDGLQTDEPIWLATGEDSAAAAEPSCDTVGPDGGTVELVQYNGSATDGSALDMDVACAVPAS